MTVDSYAFLPRAFRAIYEGLPTHDHEPVWAPMPWPVDEARIGLLSSAGLFVAREQEPFDVEREKQEPNWGDPTMRVLPGDLRQDQVDARHLHIRTDDLFVDVNVSLPVHRLAELVEAGVVGEAAPEHYSLMGFQEEGAEVWRTETAPEIAARCRAAEIDALILAPA